MKRQHRIAFSIIFCTIIYSSMAAAVDNPFLPPPLNPQSGTTHFSVKTVSGKTMVSSGFPNGSMTFNSNGSLTCTNYPAFVKCKNWQIQKDGTLLRRFTDSHTGTVQEVEAIWKLLSGSKSTLQVQQTSSNSEGAAMVTVTIQ